jgi:CP family cyanate transporter-like MFS transporter
VISSTWWLIRISRSKEVGQKEVSSKFHKALFRKPGAWHIAIFFGLQSMLFYGTATWLPTILVSKGYTLGHAGLVVSITGFLGSAIGIAAPHYASKLKNMRMFLFLMGLMVAASFAAVIFDSGWRLVIWILISNIGLSITFPLSLLLTVTRSVEAGEVRSLSIMAQSIGYLMAAFAPGLVGAIFDATLSWNTALLVPVILGLFLGGIGYFAGKPEKIII